MSVGLSNSKVTETQESGRNTGTSQKRKAERLIHVKRDSHLSFPEPHELNSHGWQLPPARSVTTKMSDASGCERMAAMLALWVPLQWTEVQVVYALPVQWELGDSCSPQSHQVVKVANPSPSAEGDQIINTACKVRQHRKQKPGSGDCSIKRTDFRSVQNCNLGVQCRRTIGGNS